MLYGQLAMEHRGRQAKRERRALPYGRCRFVWLLRATAGGGRNYFAASSCRTIGHNFLFAGTVCVTHWHATLSEATFRAKTQSVGWVTLLCSYGLYLHWVRLGALGSFCPKHSSLPASHRCGLCSRAITTFGFWALKLSRDPTDLAVPLVDWPLLPRQCQDIINSDGLYLAQPQKGS